MFLDLYMLYSYVTIFFIIVSLANIYYIMYICKSNNKFYYDVIKKIQKR